MSGRVSRQGKQARRPDTSPLRGRCSGDRAQRRQRGCPGKRRGPDGSKYQQWNWWGPARYGRRRGRAGRPVDLSGRPNPHPYRHLAGGELLAIWPGAIQGEVDAAAEAKVCATACGRVVRFLHVRNVRPQQGRVRHRRHLHRPGPWPCPSGTSATSSKNGTSQPPGPTPATNHRGTGAVIGQRCRSPRLFNAPGHAGAAAE